MFELFASMTALPNIHPVVVHFPIALAFAALAVEVASLIARRQAWLERSAALLSALAAAGAGAAYLAGRQAADTIGVIPAAAEAVLADHADLGLWTLVGLAIAAVIRVVSSVRDRQLAVSRLGALRAAGLVALLIAVGLITRTADLGGALVYRYAVAAQTAPSETITTPAVVEDEPAVVDVGSRLVRGANGALEWRPLPIDLAALGEVIAPAKGSDPAAVSAVERPGEGGGLALEANGVSLLVLPGVFGDLVIEAEVDLSAFDGTFGLAHHVGSADEAVLFTVSTSGETSLSRHGGGEVKVFDSEIATVPSGVVALQSSVAGHHFKGFLDGRMVVHGHGDSGDPGSVGLVIDGEGVIRVLRVTVTPAGDNP